LLKVRRQTVPSTREWDRLPKIPVLSHWQEGLRIEDETIDAHYTRRKQQCCEVSEECQLVTLKVRSPRGVNHQLIILIIGELDVENCVKKDAIRNPLDEPARSS